MIDTLRVIDRQPLTGPTLDDLDMAAVQRHIQIAQERGRYEGSTDPVAYLRQFAGLVDVAGVPVPTLASVLMFAAEPERWLTACGVDIAQFSSTHAHPTDLVFSTQVRGNVAEVVDRTVDILWARSEHRYRIQGTERIEEHGYDQRVLRELTVNALCHRDWEYVGSFVRVQMFPTATEWISPGGLPPGVRPDNLRDAQTSRNPTLAQFLYHAGRVEKFGMGIDMVLDTLAAWGVDSPVVRDDPDFFSFRVWAKRLSAVGRSLPALSDRQHAILEEIRRRTSASAADLATALDQHPRNIQRDLKMLLDHQLVQGNGSKTHGRSYALVLDRDDGTVPQ